MSKRVAFFVLACFLASAAAVFGQGNTMGTVSGKVVDPDGLAMPGVTITASSPNLQGARTVVTSANGDFVLPLLPAGDYTITFELTGFKASTLSQRVSPGETIVLPATRLSLATVSESVTVVGKSEDFATTAAAGVSIKFDSVQKLPTSRNLTDTVLLSPGVNNTGPSSGITMSGGLSYEGLFLVNGVVVNENLRGQPLNLFVEDAVQETTTSVGGVSAEYGRFAGGVVNTITKSGGNVFSGSFRTNLENDAWRNKTPYNEPMTNKTVPTYTYTFGGPIIKDKIWFFTNGRYNQTAVSRQLPITSIPYTTTTTEYRLEEKFTYSITPNHNVKATIFNLATSATNYRFSGMDPRLLYDRRLPQNMYSLNYNAIMSPTMFFEVQYSQRHLAWEKDGARSTDRIQGTQLSDRATGNAYWSPTFCGVCTNESRDNRDFLVKGNKFLSTSKTGSHNFVFGVDVYDDYRFSNNHQSGSDFIVTVPRTNVDLATATFYPVLSNTTGSNQTVIQYRPILVPTKGTNIWTYSGFLNDVWRLSNTLSFNLGLRWDKNRSLDSSGAMVADNAAFSPRLSVTWDPLGHGKTTVFGSFARYVAAMANSIADAGSAGGQPANYSWYYTGPLPANNGQMTPDQALAYLFQWWDGQGGANNPNFYSISIPGLTTKVSSDLKSQYVTEYMGGMSHNFGQVTVRVDATYRPASNIYGSFTTLETGKATNPVTGAKYDKTIVDNTSTVWRRYWGVNSQFTWRVNDRVQLNGNWTVSENRGNVEGENSGSGPIRSAADVYPEYIQAGWNYPVGDLSSDQRHRGRFMGSYDLPLGRYGRLGLGLIEMINSGSPYGLSGAVRVNNLVTNPGYTTPPTNSTYWFTPRDAYRTAWNVRTDLSINYSYRMKKIEVFWQGQALNVFNRAALSGSVNTAIYTAASSGTITGLKAFNPFTDTPVQGTNWVLDPGTSTKDASGKPIPWGGATGAGSYQIPRTVRMNFGIRF